MIVLDYQDRRPLYEQVEEKFRNLILNGALEARVQNALCPAAGDGIIHQPQHHPAGLYAAGTGRADLPG